MGETIRWSPALLYRELPGPPGVVRFRYPARSEALLYLLLAIGCFALGLIVAVGVSDSGWDRILCIGLAALFLFVPTATVTVRRLWTIRLLEIDRERRELALIRRTPLRRTRESFDLDDLREITLEETDDIEPNPSHRSCRVRVEIRSGAHLLLGCAPRHRARKFARRLSDLTGVPLHIPPPGPWGIQSTEKPLF